MFFFFRLDLWFQCLDEAATSPVLIKTNGGKKKGGIFFFGIERRWVVSTRAFSGEPSVVRDTRSVSDENRRAAVPPSIAELSGD